MLRQVVFFCLILLTDYVVEPYGCDNCAQTLHNAKTATISAVGVAQFVADSVCFSNFNGSRPCLAASAETYTLTVNAVGVLLPSAQDDSFLRDVICQRLYNDCPASAQFESLECNLCFEVLKGTLFMATAAIDSFGKLGKLLCPDSHCKESIGSILKIDGIIGDLLKNKTTTHAVCHDVIRCADVPFSGLIN